MLEIDEESELSETIRAYLPDYRIHLIQPEKIEDMGVFKTNLQQIFSMVKYRSDRALFYQYLEGHRKELQKLDYTESLAAFVLLGETKTAEKYLFNGEKGAEINMCKALDDLRQEWKSEGAAAGEKRLSALINALFGDGCQNLIQQVVNDLGFREEMYQKYQL